MSASFAASRLASLGSGSWNARRIALARALLALVWAAALVAVAGNDSTSTSSALQTAAAALLASYPAIDVLASLLGARGTDASGRALRINAALSTLAVAAIAITAFGFDAGAALAAFGAWAAVSGAIQLALAIRRHRVQGRQLSLIVSGGLSTIAGISFIARSGDGRRPPHDGRRLHGARGAAFPALGTPCSRGPGSRSRQLERARDQPSLLTLPDPCTDPTTRKVKSTCPPLHQPSISRARLKA